MLKQNRRPAAVKQTLFENASVQIMSHRCKQKDKDIFSVPLKPIFLLMSFLLLLVFSFGLAGGASAACMDMDLDGYGNPGDISCPKGIKVDCDDTDPLVYPTAPKICDGKDNNCDGLKDFASDEDKDHDGVMWCANDCDDNNAAKYPGNYEIYGTPACTDGIDNDCNSKTDNADPTCTTPCIDKDADGYGFPGTIYCASGSSTHDCNDNNATVNPGRADNDCNGVDNDCDGLKDEVFVVTTTNCGVGACAATGQNICQSATLVNTCVPLPVGFEGPVGAPSCSDGIDNNCNGTVDGADGFCMNFCIDVDGDSYGANGAAVCPMGAIVDCNDSNANINPGKTDTTCNGVDENCSGANDEGYVPTGTTCGVGGCARTGQFACQAGAIVNTCTAGTPVQEGPLGRVTCTDNIDNNCDGFTDLADTNCAVSCIDKDNDGYGNPGDAFCPKGSKTDCNDNDSSVYPGAAKICDGKDNNCDGVVDFATDVDQDGDGVMWCANDCDDRNANKFPGNYEIYGTAKCTDGLDNDCNNKKDATDPTCTTPCIDKDSDGYGKPGTPYCTSGSSAMDCNDADAAINPGASDANCDGKDNDCDGAKDEAFTSTTTNCGVGECANTGQTTCTNGVQGNTCVPKPGGFEGPFGSPSCIDGIDNNCNGVIDGNDGYCMNFCIDTDGDGYGANGAAVCTVPLVVDCDDTNPNINPNKTDTTCNGVDENCSGVNDEGYVPTATSCGVGGCTRAGQLACQNGAIVDTCVPGAPGSEGPLGQPSCTDNIDNNCNGLTDAADIRCQVSCIDLDHDGYGNPADVTCPSGNKVDCNDNDNKVFPGAAKICDGKDNNCDGLKDFSTDEDKDHDGIPWCGGDCDDRNANRFPGNSEDWHVSAALCSDGIDNDCDLKVDLTDQGCYPPSCSTKNATRDGVHMFDLKDQATGNTIMTSCTWCHVDAQGNNMRPNCQRCHASTSDASNPLNGVLKQQYPLNPPYGFGTAKNVKVHSSTQVGTTHGNWTPTCLTCHNPHLQEQNAVYGTTYGKYIKEYVCFDNTANGGSNTKELIKFTSATGSGSFADGAPFNQNICEMCHTKTTHNRRTGNAPGDLDGQGAYIGHKDGENCMGCHSHSTGFKKTANAETIYATGNDGTSLITIDSGSGAATVIGPTGTVETFATAFSPNGTLYTVTGTRSNGASSYLGYFNLATGAVTTVGGPLGVGYMTSLEFAPNGTLYGGSFGGPDTYGTDNYLYTIDTATGTPTLVGNLAFEGVMDFAFDSGGTLWAVGISGTSDSALYTINLATGAGTYVRDITGASYPIMGIMFDSSGTLYASDHGYPSLLYRIDISTGAATTVGDTGIMMSHGGDISVVKPIANAETIYATGNDGTSLITIDSGSGVATVIGSTGTVETFATAFSPDGALYTVTGTRSDGANSYLGYFNLATGAVTTVGGPLGVGYMTSLEFAPNGTLYGGSFGGPETYGTDNYLYTIDTATGTPTLVGSLAFEGVMDFAFDSGGALWAVGISGTSDSALYTINLATGAGTYVRDITGAFTIMGIMFDSSGTLYATDHGSPSLLYRIDISTGAATTVGDTGIMMSHGGDISGVPGQ